MPKPANLNSEKLIQSIRSFASFSDEEVKGFTDLVEEVRLSKGDVLLDIGQICDQICFIDHGSLRQYYTDSEHDEVITNLFLPHEWVFDHASFTGRKPAQARIEAFDDCILLSISIHNIHHLIEQSQRYFALGKILELGITPLTNPKSTPEEKYLKLLEQKPQLIQTFPLKYIASYLGMTPETLSRVRKKIS